LIPQLLQVLGCSLANLEFVIRFQAKVLFIIFPDTRPALRFQSNTPSVGTGILSPEVILPVHDAGNLSLLIQRLKCAVLDSYSVMCFMALS
jgi:hypothetical protein